ncbi:hypothetical protein FD723_18460 [Nostoc sp. C052]|uniref:hypothetical protein n=1 Tax=Nostoc sp. C052 TaxID=2576902 RepID=UPI0015C3FF46|nr:hypothetical protein [Nostoc sp. C052]QLE42205.1 hypothetical protein FD723_18460 [Nostoc sp. C052]
MAFTRSELFQHFEGEYTQAQIIQGLSELAAIDKRIDPNGEEFDETIIEQLEDTFGIIQEAVDKHKLLVARGENLVPVEEIAMELVGEKTDIPINVFKGFVDIVAGEAIARAVLEHQLSETVYNQTLTDLDVKSLEAKNQQAANRISLMSHLIQNPQTVERILEDYGINNNANTQTQLAERTASCTLDFDPDEFLLEVGAGKKPQSIKTIPDTQLLTKQLLKRYLRD